MEVLEGKPKLIIYEGKMKKRVVVITSILFFLIFFPVNYYRAFKLSNDYESFKDKDFLIIEVMQKSKNLVFDKNSKDFLNVQAYLKELFRELSIVSPAPSKGSLQEACTVKLYFNDNEQYLLKFNYIGVNAINVRIYNDTNFSIQKNYYIYNDRFDYYIESILNYE